MKLRLLLPLATLLAFAALSLHYGAETAKADLVSLNLSTNNTVFGDTVTVTGTVNNVAGSYVTLKVSNGVLTSPTASGGKVISGSGTNALSLTGAAGTSIETIT